MGIQRQAQWQRQSLSIFRLQELDKMKVWFGRICSILAICIVLGCEPTKPTPSKATTSMMTEKELPDADHGHTHGDGPHGGMIVDWGGGAYHVEFTVDHDNKEATIYILGSDEKSPAPVRADNVMLFIDDPMTDLQLAAKPLEGETGGKSSRYVGTHDTIGIVKEFAGTISGEIEGTPYTGDFKEEPHADHKH
jgi:hypothetical protein